MTQDEIIEMASKCLLIDKNTRDGIYVDALIAYAKLVAQHERDEIIVMAESHAFSRMRGEFTPTSTDLICAIRARGQA